MSFFMEFELTLSIMLPNNKMNNFRHDNGEVSVYWQNKPELKIISMEIIILDPSY